MSVEDKYANGLQLKDSSCKPQQAVRYTQLEANMVPTNELSIETMERIVKLIQESKTKAISSSQPAVTKHYCK